MFSFAPHMIEKHVILFNLTWSYRTVFKPASLPAAKGMVSSFPVFSNSLKS
jgi:hypothetical protein